jgi:hypothetical protein
VRADPSERLGYDYLALAVRTINRHHDLFVAPQMHGSRSA